MCAPPVLNLHKALHGRTEAICSDVTTKDQETRHIRQGLVDKGHPRKVETFVNPVWHVKSGSRSNMSTPSHKGLSSCYLAAALRCVRQCAGRPDLSITSEGMPQEWEYADDVDFADEECEPLDSLLQTVCTQLRVWNLP